MGDGMNNTAILGLVALALIASSRRKKKSVKRVAQEPLAIDQPAVYVHNGRLQIGSIDRWRAVAAPAIEQALTEGSQDAERILASVMRRLLPRMAWPPRQGTIMYPQWKAMVADMRDALSLEPEPSPMGNGRGKLHIVGGSR